MGINNPLSHPLPSLAKMPCLIPHTPQSSDTRAQQEEGTPVAISGKAGKQAKGSSAQFHSGPISGMSFAATGLTVPPWHSHEQLTCASQGQVLVPRGLQAAAHVSSNSRALSWGAGGALTGGSALLGTAAQPRPQTQCTKRLLSGTVCPQGGGDGHGAQNGLG